MRKKLAIKGHFTRGKEVIELLEMLGGVNGKINKKTGETYNIYNGRYFIDEICNVREVAYYIDFESQIRCIDIKDITTNFIVYSLEMFFETFPFKVGDKVVYTKFGDNCDEYPVTIESMKWTGTTIEYTFNDCVTCLAKDLKMWNGEPDAVISGIYLNSCDYADEVELNLGDYEIEVRDGKTYAVKKKPKYPKNCSECENVLGIQDTIIAGCLGYEYRLMNNFQRLFMCRNAYWKIAGEQMGLGKPWEPNWTTFEGIPAIFRFRYNIVCDSVKDQHCLLVFPTTEMRDAFYENFRDLIESCKELL
jgi:hypothetical protein